MLPFIPPESTRKLKCFLVFSEGENRNIGQEWIKSFLSKFNENIQKTNLKMLPEQKFF